jgi:hypothetical protein
MRHTTIFLKSDSELYAKAIEGVVRVEIIPGCSETIYRAFTETHEYEIPISSVFMTSRPLHREHEHHEHD